MLNVYLDLQTVQFKDIYKYEITFLVFTFGCASSLKIKCSYKDFGYVQKSTKLCPLNIKNIQAEVKIKQLKTSRHVHVIHFKFYERLVANFHSNTSILIHLMH